MARVAGTAHRGSARNAAGVRGGGAVAYGDLGARRADPVARRFAHVEGARRGQPSRRWAAHLRDGRDERADLDTAPQHRLADDRARRPACPDHGRGAVAGRAADRVERALPRRQRGRRARLRARVRRRLPGAQRDGPARPARRPRLVRARGLVSRVQHPRRGRRRCGDGRRPALDRGDLRGRPDRPGRSRAGPVWEPRAHAGTLTLLTARAGSFAGMTVTAITSYNFSLFLHITAVMVGFGSTFALSVTTPIALKLDPRHLPYVHQLSQTLNRFFASPALLIVLITGFYQVSEGNWDLGDFWVSATIVIVVVIGALMGMVFAPSARKLKALSERDIAAAPPGGQVTISDEYNQRARAEMIAGPITGLLLVIAVFLMVTKPGM